jgi:hypothetical protein
VVNRIFMNLPTTDMSETPADATGRARLDDGPATSRRTLGQPALYAALVVGAMLVAGVYGLRSEGIFACRADGYAGGRYLALCDVKSYGDYDHGAFWFGLELPSAALAEDAEVLFLGTSRMQLALSTDTVAAWFSAAPATYYLFGFSHSENTNFVAPLLERLRPRAKAYVINLDLFFSPLVTEPARVVMRDGGARGRYVQKRSWQRLHRAVCASIPRACRDEHAFFRTPETGAWVVAGGVNRPSATSFEDVVNDSVLQVYLSRSREFIAARPAPDHCIILTVVPTVRTPWGTLRSLADSLGLPFVAPRPDSLLTFDGSHLDGPSAQRWSSAFLAAAGPLIRRCIAEANGLASGSGR